MPGPQQGATGGQRLGLAQAMELATRHQGEGRLREAEAVLREILKAAPQHAPALHLLGIIAHQSGQSDLAAGLIGEALEVRPSAGLFHTNLCEILRQQGDLAGAIEHGHRGAELDPGSATAHSNLGVALYDNDDFDAAETCQRHALELAPGLPQALNNLGSIFRQREARERAIECYRAALAAAPNHLEALNNLGALLTEMEQTDEAREMLLRAIKLNPQYAEAHRNIGAVFLQEEAFDNASVAFSEALKHRPGYIEALVGLAIVARECNEFDESERTLQQALDIDPESAAALTQLATLYSETGFPERAGSLFDQAIAIEPESDACLVAKGHLQTQIGDIEGAERTLLSALAIKPDSISAQLSLVQLKKVKPDDPALKTLEEELGRLDASATTRRMPLHFGLGKCYDDLGEHTRAIEHFLAGCRLKHARIDYHPDENEQHIDQIIATFDRAFIERLSGAGDDSELPVFVLGMPRSGTTLTEQIVASHSAAHGAGELPDLLTIANHSPVTGRRLGYPASIANITARELAELGCKYIHGLRERDPAARRITDKMPANFYCVGLIHLMLPRARIVHVRRNPVDTCLSGITKLFRHGQQHSYDLAEQGRFYVDYARLMAHWRALLPADAFFEIRYEDLVADTETHARALIDYCGLDWEDGCLDFHKTERSVRTASVTQVRQPIYQTSVARWRRYEHALGPLLDALGPLVER
jgi:tetratricopeptide (TPR) repeat protein